MNQLEAFQMIDDQITRDLRSFNRHSTFFKK